MRIVIDVQSCQARNKDRGIGRYSLSLAQAMAKLGRGHEIWFALNALFPDTSNAIRNAFEGLVSPERIVVWDAPGPVAAYDLANTWRKEAAELVREFFFASLQPDIAHISSLFEGWDDDAITSVGKGPEVFPTAVTLYDLIPLVFEHVYLRDSQIRSWYYQKLQGLKCVNLWLAISEHTRHEAIERLGLPEDRVFSIRAGSDPRAHPIEIDAEMEANLRARYGFSRPFLLYTGGIDYRKNLEGLIKAYALLPRRLRNAYQLVITCTIQEHAREHFAKLVRREGLHPSDVMFTGFVPDDDLILLYNLCAIFVFPSLYEGFGLPPLDAMACGAPVVASNTSSLPEVVGWEKALFDPKTPEAIAEKMHEVLTDEAFREALREHGLEQAKHFSWEESAQRALAAFETFYSEHARTKPHLVTPRSFKPRLAYLSPLHPVRSGIAAYSRQLLPELARYYRIELIVDQPEVSDPWLSANYPIRTVEWFEQHADRYDRILYHFGNAEFHNHMYELLRRHAGVIVLHDFYLSDGLRSMSYTGYAAGIFRRELYRSHGYGALANLAEVGEEVAVSMYPCNLSVISDADGVIVHSRYATKLADQWYGKGTAKNCRIIPQPLATRIVSDRTSVRAQLGLGDRDFLVCSFGFIAPRKLSDVILEGWLSSKLARNPGCKLVFVGHPFDEVLERNLGEKAKQARLSDRFQITGYVPRPAYERYLTAADVSVQLRTESRGETSRAVLDSLAWGLPTVVNAHGWMAELPDGVALKLPEQVRALDVARALDELYDNPDRRRLGEAGQAYIGKAHAPQRVAEAYSRVIEHFAESGRHARRRRLIRAIAQIESIPPPRKIDLATTSMCVAENLGHSSTIRQLFVAVSRLSQEDLQTGIERVTRAVLKQLVAEPPYGFRVEPVYAALPSSYRYASAFMTEYFGLPSSGLCDEVVEVSPRDVFLGLDWEPHLVPDTLAFFAELRRRNAEVWFVVYDLLPARYSEWFPPELCLMFDRWLRSVTQVADGIACISRSVADQVLGWLDTTHPCRSRPLKISYFHLGSDVENASDPRGGTLDLQALGRLPWGGPVFLMVGTVDPWKGHTQALEAFEELWESGVDVSLVMVGRRTWRKSEPVLERHRNCLEQGTRLFWLEGASDDTLLELYRRSTALIMASRDEGFGLPLIEAARHGLPIIARDTPVFREICGDHAFYFDGTDAGSLASAIEDWLELHRRGKAPAVEGMSVLSWEQSTQQLLGGILNGNWYKTWEPDGS